MCAVCVCRVPHCINNAVFEHVKIKYSWLLSHIRTHRIILMRVVSWRKLAQEQNRNTSFCVFIFVCSMEKWITHNTDNIQSKHTCLIACVCKRACERDREKCVSSNEWNCIIIECMRFQMLSLLLFCLYDKVAGDRTCDKAWTQCFLVRWIIIIIIIFVSFDVVIYIVLCLE